MKFPCISALQQVYNLLNEDLQLSVDYWLGFVYFNSGHFINSFKLWKKYLENADRAFDSSLKKVEKIRAFLKQYEILVNSISDFKKNLQFVKKYTINKSYNGRKNSNCISSRNSKEYNERSSIDINSLSNGKSKNLRSSQFYKKNNDTSIKNKIFLDNNDTSGNKLNYYIDTLQNIREIEPNLKNNKCQIYEYYKAVSIFYVESI